jgi:hypothetical protein
MAAPTFGAQASTNGGNVASLTLAAFSISGSNVYLLVFVGTAAPDLSTSTISSVTSNGTNMGSPLWTKSDAGNNYRISCYALKGAVTGDIVANFTGTSTEQFLGASYYNGVDQTTPAGTAATATGVAPTANTVTVTSATGELVVDGTFVRDPAITGNGGQTVEINKASATYSLASSDKVGAASVAMGWGAITSGADWVIGGVSLKPVAAPADTLMGQAWL